MKLRAQTAVLAAILLATIAVYFRALDGTFELDDGLILESAWVRDLGVFLHPRTWLDLPRPLTAFTFALDHAVFGFDVRGWHATSGALHLIAVILGWRLARQVMFRAGNPAPEAAALGAVAVFALHPIQTEAVSYISQRAEVLSAVLSLTGLLVLLRWDEARTRGHKLLLAAGAVAALALGLAAKPTAAALPALWLGLAAALPSAEEREVPSSTRLLRRLPAALPLIALSATEAMRALVDVRGSTSAGLDVPGAPWPLYVATELRAIPRYLSLLAWPAGQTVDWDFRPSASILDPAVLAGAALLASLGAVALVGARRRSDGAGAAAGRAAAFGFVFFLVGLSPTVLVPLADPLAEHRVYLPALGVAIAAAAAAGAVIDRMTSVRLRGAALVSAAAIVVALGGATLFRNDVWRSAAALWGDAAAKSPAKGRPHANLCRALLIDGRTEEAVRACDRAVELGVPAQEQVALRFLALGLMTLGRMDEARARILRGLERAPAEGDTLAVLAKIELSSGRVDQAETIARDAIARDGAARGHVVLGEILETRHDLAAAAQAYAAAAQVAPAEALPWLALGAVHERRGHVAEACAAYARASDVASFSSAQRARARASRLGCR
ncbi:MAG TPA: tetratricopeptide repeat protein [Anaeromyxobacter sp.]